MSNLNVTYAELDTTANQLQQGQGDLEQILTHQRQLVANRVSSGFITDAASGVSAVLRRLRHDPVTFLPPDGETPSPERALRQPHPTTAGSDL